MTGPDAVHAVALVVHASDNADLGEPGTWADLDAEQEHNYLKLAAGLINAGLITWPPSVPDAPLDPTATEHLAALVHNNVDRQWPNWADLHDGARGYVRDYVSTLDAAGLLDHSGARKLISAPGFRNRPDIWAERCPITWAPSVPDDPPF
ncbi:hypothetical protein [Nocardia higoensis]|uniref:hypothetical protein n=1 Tax=Nocardia higoensis TaxID=228599 RepID=UPI0002FB0088|nr:hypothetical protein [Nocardia higoensis]